MNKKNHSTKQNSLRIKTNVKGGFTPQPEPPGLVHMGRNLGDLVDPGSIMEDVATSGR